MIVLGLTGGIGTGKSTVARLLFEHYNVPVVDADQLSRDVMAVGQPAYHAILNTFGTAVIGEHGELDRTALRDRVFSDSAARADLEAITHPAIRSAIGTRLQSLMQEGERVAIVEAALLVETGSYRQYPELIVVTCSTETQIARITERDDVDIETAQRILAAQMPTEAKVAVASIVIQNDGTLSELRDAVAVAWRTLIDKHPELGA